MNSNPYEQIFIDNDEGMANAYKKRFPRIDSIMEKSFGVGKSFMLCHVVLGLDDAVRILNETLNGILVDNRRDAVIKDVSAFSQQTLQALSFLKLYGKEHEICMELADELTHVKSFNAHANFIKPKFLKAIKPI